MDLLKGFHSEFAWFIYGMLILATVWFFMGGPNNETAHEGAYIEPPAPLDSGRVYGTYYEGGDINQPQTLNLPQGPGNFIRKADAIIESFLSQARQAQEVNVASFLTKKIYFEDFAKAKENNVDKEFLHIVGDDSIKGSERISGLVLRGSGLNKAIVIPKAVNLPVLGTTPEKVDVYLQPGGKAIITTGRSPIGSSFRVNKCMGYLQQFQNFYPDIANICPPPANEIKSFGPANDTICVEFVEKTPRCTIPQGAPPRDLTASCVNFLAEKLNYNACVANHKNDKDFYSKEWRLFLNQDSELWKNKNEIIRLTEANGTIIDSITY
jgi:hypothetical protein